MEKSIDEVLKEFEEDIDELNKNSNSNQNIIWGNQIRQFLKSTDISQSDLQDFESAFGNIQYSSNYKYYDTMKMFIKLLRRKNLKLLSKMDSLEYIVKNAQTVQPIQTIKTQRIQSALGYPRTVLASDKESNISGSSTIKKNTSNKIFIVHGHDENSKLVLENMLREMGLEPIILHKQANKGKTIIEKFEAHADEVNFAFVLFTPDDIGRKQSGEHELKPRARQNVILEFGYFLGKLGRQRVCCLYKQDVELPTDMQGLVFVPFSSSPDDSYRQIRKELIAAGYNLKQD